ncbi:MAG: anaerobic nitric oxide reductase flavorubredoxin [Sphaerochaetaceae bacterium]|jgi:flavorubredoxin|nr:anaerobic nitric oxide reductase flavorubredoxin [Sphaerochaetaceae bacterium]MDD2404870.1 anaerobic nitric oxide reductase flavorubredoxin [Sphaerochaetaceae bacterium]MDD3669911.1 anaerobic nitric oxide reductase flavorubredoxin [Sphaerochaetaceae bacterium]MDD4259765.1 anaerobic nitric oxide reductase flavorubredoxin [Sphaerochaetaceae bacterium]MDD4762792.1 anaerobic nitric oxide reductase flavorubredoxin [Sphaerochaetaceae bacterium]
MVINVKNNVDWVGKIDWELRSFHGSDYSTHRGSSYNSYLVREEKTVLIDTVWLPYAEEFVENLDRHVGLDNIDYLIANHGEVDHSGALPALMAKRPDLPIYCTAKAVDSLKGQYHEDWNFNVVKTGDSIDIGNGKKLVFVEMTMLHWPDSMATYLTGDNILFSNDAFGQHYATTGLFNDLADISELEYEAMKYYANILTPFSAILRKKLADIIGMNLPIDIIATSHGVIWRDNPVQIVEKYAAWADDYKENRITIVYDTMWDGTRSLADTIAAGIHEADPSVTVKVFNISKGDRNDIITEVFRSKMLIVGSPTVGNNMLSTMAGLLHFVKELKFKKKKAAAFGCYGWTGEAPKIMSEFLQTAGFEIVSEPLRQKWNPDQNNLKEVFEYGKKLAKA